MYLASGRNMENVVGDQGYCITSWDEFENLECFQGQVCVQADR